MSTHRLLQLVYNEQFFFLQFPPPIFVNQSKIHDLIFVWAIKLVVFNFKISLIVVDYLTLVKQVMDSVDFILVLK